MIFVLLSIHGDYDRIFFEYVATTFLPLSTIVMRLQTTLLTPKTTTTVLGFIWLHAPLINNLIAVSALTVLCYMAEAFKSVAIQTLLVPFTILLYRRGVIFSRRLRDEKLKDNTKALNHFNLSKLPKLVVSTIVSYLYVSR